MRNASGPRPDRYGVPFELESRDRNHQPDVVGLQEAWKLQINALAAAFPEFGMIGRSHQQDPEKGEWCPTLYRKDKFEVVSEGSFWLSDTPVADKEGSMSWGNRILRICTWRRFKDKNVLVLKESRTKNRPTKPPSS